MANVFDRSEESFLWATGTTLKDDFSKVSKTYLYSNEKMGLLYRSILYFLSNNDTSFSKDKTNDCKSLQDTNVLCVAGSGDQAFWALSLGANVDIFDSNCLSIYYFYLRKWLIEYHNKFYFEFDDIFNVKITDLIKDLLTKVVAVSEDEKAAYNYWRLYISLDLDITVSDLFIDGECIGGNNLDDKNIEILKNRLSSYNGDFYNFDLTEPNIDLSKKYDIIVLSNILEHVSFDKLNVCMENISRLLNENGVAICSYLMLKCYDVKRREQASILSELFDSTELTPSQFNSCDIGFTLQKKK